jgi:hypothetical protein
MKRAAGWFVVLAACGPLLVPMAGRLNDQDQATVDRGWDRALAPVDRLSHADWLDVFVGASVFEEGVDRLSFRSEKSFSDGKVVMAIEFDRSRPSEDRFTMEVRDRRGTVVRREAYGRDEVIHAARTLYRQAPNEDLTTKEARERRWAKIREYFPAASSPDASPG